MTTDEFTKTVRAETEQQPNGTAAVEVVPMAEFYNVPVRWHAGTLHLDPGAEPDPVRVRGVVSQVVRVCHADRAKGRGDVLRIAFERESSGGFTVVGSATRKGDESFPQTY